MADRESDAQGFAEQAVDCSGCGQQSAVSIRNTGAGLVAELAGEKTHVSVIDDPIQIPDDEWKVEAYQRANLPSDPGQIFKFATYDIDYIASEMERGSLGCQRRSESRPVGRNKTRPVWALRRPLAKRAFQLRGSERAAVRLRRGG
jgi:hypothetical protein